MGHDVGAPGRCALKGADFFLLLRSGMTGPKTEVPKTHACRRSHCACVPIWWGKPATEGRAVSPPAAKTEVGDGTLPRWAVCIVLRQGMKCVGSPGVVGSPCPNWSGNFPGIGPKMPCKDLDTPEKAKKTTFFAVKLHFLGHFPGFGPFRVVLKRLVPPKQPDEWRGPTL